MDINKDKIRQKIKKLPNVDVLTFVSKQLGVKPAEFITKNIFNMLTNSIKNGAIKTVDITKSIANLDDKNKDDDTGIDWDNVKIDDSTVKYKFLLSKDILKAFQEQSQSLGKELKDVEKESESIDNNVKKRISDKGVKVSDEDLKNNKALIVNTVEGKGQEKKSGKELTAEIKQKKEKIKKIVQEKIKADETRQKKMKSPSSSSKTSNVEQGNTQDLQKKIKTEVLGKIAGSYKKKFKFGIYETNQFKQQLKQSLNKSLNKIDQSNIIAASINFQPQDAQKVVSEKESKPGYKVRILRRNDDDKFLTKIKDTIRKSIISNVEKGKLGKVSYSYYKYWTGEGSEKHLNTIFVFFGYNMEQNQINEDLSPARYGGTLSKIIINNSNNLAQFKKILSQGEIQSLRNFLVGQDAEYNNSFNMTIEASGETFKSFQDAVDHLGEDHPVIQNLLKKEALGRLSGLKVLKKIINDKKLQHNFLHDDIERLKQAVLPGENVSNELIDQEIEFESHAISEFDESLQISNTTETAKEITNGTGSKPDDLNDQSDQNIPEEAKEKQPLFKKGTLFGWLRVGAKVSGYILNHGKSLVDKLGAIKIAHEEDSNLYAEAKFLIQNENEDKNYSDSQFSIRYSLSDNKWHATNIDDRKMKIDEQKLIDAFKKTQSWKDFHNICVKRLDDIHNDANIELLISQLQSIKNSKINPEIIKNMTNIIQNYKKIKENL